MAGSGQMNRRYPNQQPQQESQGSQQRSEAVQSAARGAKNEPRIYSMQANTVEAQRILAENLTYGVSRKPDIIQRVQLTPEWLGLKENDETLEYAGRQSILMQTSVDSDLRPHLENIQFEISGNKNEFNKQFEHLKGRDVLNEGMNGTKELEIKDMDNYNNQVVYNGSANGLVFSRTSSVTVEKAIVGNKFSRVASEKAAIVINTGSTHTETDMTQPNKQKGFITNVSGGPMEISPQTVEIYRFYNAYNIKEFSAYMKEQGEPLPYINAQFAKISAYEQEKIITSLARDLYGDTALLNSPGTQFVDKMGYLREHHSETFEEFKKLADKAMEEYSLSKETTIREMLNYREPDARNIADVKRSTIQITDQVLEGADYQKRMSESISQFRESLSHHKVEELELTLERKADSKDLLASAVRFDLEQRLEKEKKKEEYLQAIQTFKEFPFYEIKDKNGNEIDDRYEIIRECGFTTPEKIDTMTLDDFDVQIQNVTREASKIIPTSTEATQGIEQDPAMANKAENIRNLLNMLAKMQEAHPDNFAIDTKNLYEYGSHDRLTVDIQTMDSLTKLKEGSKIPVLRNVTYDTLASRESCEAARDALQKYIDEDLKVAYHKDGRVSKLTNYQALVDSVDVREMFGSHVITDESSRPVKIDFSKISDEDIKRASEEFAKNLEVRDRNQSIVLESAIRAKIALEIIDQHAHSQDYAFNADLTKQIIDENNRTLILKYVAEHHEEIQKIRNEAREERLDESATLARIEKHISVHCNIPADEMMRIRQETNETNTVMQSDFLRSEIFKHVATYGVPEGTTFKTFSEACGIKDMSDLENPAKCREIITRLDSVIDEMKGITPVGEKGASTFTDDGRLSVYESIRSTIAQHVVTNNLEQLQTQVVSYEYDEKILQKISYTRDEQSILSNSPHISPVYDLNTPYGVHAQSVELQIDSQRINDAIALLKTKLENGEEVKINSEDIAILSDGLKAAKISVTDVSFDTSENIDKCISKLSAVNAEITEAKDILDSKLHPVVEDKASLDGFRPIEYHPSQEQKAAIENVEASMRAKEEFIRFAIEYEDKDANFSEIRKAFEKQHPESEIVKNPEYSDFLEKAETIPWRDISSYTSFTEINPSLEVGKTNPVLLDAARTSYEVENQQVAMLLRDDLAEITRIADKSIQQDIFRENMLQACRENPGVDSRTFEEFQERTATQLKAQALSDMLYKDEDGKLHWNLTEKVDLTSYDKVSTEELLKVREDIKTAAAEEIKDILKSGEIRYSVEELKTLQNCPELQHLFDAESKVPVTPERLISHDTLSEELNRLKSIDNPTPEILAAREILEAKDKLNYNFEAAQQELQTVGATKFGTASIHEMLHDESSTSRTIYEIDKEVTNIQYTKLAAETIETAKMQKDLTIVTERLKQIEALQEQRENLEVHSHETATWKEKWLNFIHHGRENPEHDLKKTNPEIERIDAEIARAERDIAGIQERYGKKDVPTEDFVRDMGAQIQSRENFALQVESLQSKYAQIIENIPAETKEEFRDLAAKPLATWSKDDRALFMNSQEFDSPLKRIVFEKQLDQDIERAQAYTECKALVEMKDMLTSVQEVRENHGLTHHEVQQVNYRSIGENISANEANNDLENLRTVARDAERSYSQLTELRAHVETVVTTSGSEHDLKTNLEMIKTIDDAHKAFAKAAQAYNEALQAHQTGFNADGKALSAELSSFATEAYTREVISDRILGQSEAGVVFDREEPIVIPERSEILADYVKTHEASHEYHEVYDSKVDEHTADTPSATSGIRIELDERAAETEHEASHEDIEEAETSSAKSMDDDLAADPFAM